MVNNIIEPYFSKVPAVVCTAGSYIALANSPAKGKLRDISKGELLYDHMAPEDVLCFEASFAADVSSSVFSFPLEGFYGYTKGTAAFEMILGRRFAVVFLSDGEEDGEQYIRQILKSSPHRTEESVSAFAKELLGIPECRFENDGKRGLIDIKSATASFAARVRSMYPYRDIKIALTENEEMKSAYYMPCRISMRSYMEIMMLLAFAVNELSTSRCCEIRLCRYDMSCEVRVITDSDKIGDAVSNADDLEAVCPFLVPTLAVCRYVAATADSTLSAFCNEGKLSLVISFGEKIFEDADFKSRDPLLTFEEDISFVYGQVSRLIQEMQSSRASKRTVSAPSRL